MNANNTATTETNSTSTPADLFFQTKVEANEPTLKQLAQEVNSLQEQIVSNDTLAANHGRIALDCAYQAGRRLNRAKSIIGAGEWMDWVTNNIKGVTHRTVNRYMAFATKLEGKYSSTTFDDRTSLREACIRLGIISKKEKINEKKPKAPTPEEIKETNFDAYKAKFNSVYELEQEKIVGFIRGFDSRIDWNMSTWRLEDDKPTDNANQISCLLNILADYMTTRGYETTLTLADETRAKSLIALTALTKAILLGNNPSAGITPESLGLKRLVGLPAVELNSPAPIEATEALPV